MMQAELCFFPGVVSAGLSSEHALSEEPAGLPSNATSPQATVVGSMLLRRSGLWRFSISLDRGLSAGPLCSH